MTGRRTPGLKRSQAQADVHRHLARGLAGGPGEEKEGEGQAPPCSLPARGLPARPRLSPVQLVKSGLTLSSLRCKS